MLTLRPNLDGGRPPRLLFLGAHSDDIEIGCGAAVLRLLSEHPGAAVQWVVFAATPERAAEARASAIDFLAGAERPEVLILEFPDAYFPSHIADIKRRFESFKSFKPDVIFTHCGHDRHQDHGVLSQLTWNTFRNHLVLEYEVPKYDADLRSPNFFIPVPEPLARKKASLIRTHFATQSAKQWMDEALFMGLMRLRGVECCSPTGYAEGFHVRKACL
jgi:LmbE family N-acetylglucosaminyl deacetylase